MKIFLVWFQNSNKMCIEFRQFIVNIPYKTEQIDVNHDVNFQITMEPTIL